MAWLEKIMGYFCCSFLFCCLIFFTREKEGEKVFWNICQIRMEEVVLDGAVICCGYQSFPVAVLITRYSELWYVTSKKKQTNQPTNTVFFLNSS